MMNKPFSKSRRVRPKESGVPLSADKMRALREHNKKAAFEARVRTIVDHFNELLEQRGYLEGYVIDDMTLSLTDAVVKKFKDAGWVVSIKADQSYESVHFTIKLD